MFRNEWYVRMLSRENPELVLQTGMNLAQAVYFNSSLAPIYAVRYHPSIGGLVGRPENLLYRLVKPEELGLMGLSVSPLWRWLNDETMPQDWREQSVVSNYKEWFWRAGDAAAGAGKQRAAERLFHTGLSIRSGRINYAYDIESRLYLGLANLYQGRGLVDQARQFAAKAAMAREKIDPKGP